MGRFLDYNYTLFVDEAGDDKVDRLKPDFESGNSEWLCLGGYLVRAEIEADLDRRRDTILKAIGGDVMSSKESLRPVGMLKLIS